MFSFQGCWHFRGPKQPGNGGGNLDWWITTVRKCLQWQWPTEGWAKGRHGSGERETSKPLSAPLSKNTGRLCARSPLCESFPCQESSQTAWWLSPGQISRRWGLCNDFLLLPQPSPCCCFISSTVGCSGICFKLFSAMVTASYYW